MAGIASSLWQDLRFAIRSLNKDRRFTLLAVLALALGIGSVTVIFSAVYGVLIDTFPYAHFDRMVSFSIDSIGEPSSREMLSVPEFLDFRDQNKVFEDMNAGYGGAPVIYTHGHQTAQWTVSCDSANGYQFLGVKPLIGRLIVPDDTKPGAQPVFMMTYKLWKEQFNSDPRIIGQTFDLGGVLYRLIAVMPPRFRAGWSDIFTAYPIDRGQVASDPALKDAEVWPLGFLKPGVTIPQAAADLDLVAHNLAKVYPDRYPKRFRVTARSFRTRVSGMFEPILYPLLGAVFLLLLISCSNVANLLLSRATVRDREIAVRSSLGATRWRLIRQLLVESFVLAGAGCAAGCFFAYLGLKEFVPLIPYDNFPQESVIQLNWIVLLAAMGLAVLATVLCGLVPAVHAVAGPLHPRLSGSGKGAGAGHGHASLRSALLVSEVGLSIVLLIGAGLMMRTLFAMTHMDGGYDPEHILALDVEFPPGFYGAGPQRKTFFDQVLARIRQIPGVTDAAVAGGLTGTFAGNATISGSVHSDKEAVRTNLVSEDYLQIFGSHLLQGRQITAEDVAAARRVAVVDQTFARQFFPNGNALGQKIDFEVYDRIQAQTQAEAAKSANPAAAPGGTPSKTYFDIVGVVSNVHIGPVADHPRPSTFLPSTALESTIGSVIIRTAGKADRLTTAVTQQVWSVDRNVQLGTDTGSLEGLLKKFIYAQPEFEFVMLTTFAAVGLLLVVIGIYSVMAYNVSLQTREIGIRMALGAQQSDVLRAILRKGAILTGIGAGVGIFASWALTRLLRNQLWQVKPTDPWTFGVVILLVAIVGILACVVPARRATRVDPLDALRHE